LDIVGDGPLWQACVDEIANYDLEDCVRLHGAQGSDFVQKLLGKAEIFVQHSVTALNGDMESFGVSLVEAMASSIPVVATDHNGFSETVSNGETGLLIAEHDVNGMADAMIALLENRPQAEAMGHAGRARVKERFTHDRTAARLREIMGIEVTLDF
jgi:glycosyltransferase involved in cell wall biosynthesis